LCNTDTSNWRCAWCRTSTRHRHIKHVATFNSFYFSQSNICVYVSIVSGVCVRHCFIEFNWLCICSVGVTFT
jgi:hypothetical protein